MTANLHRRSLSPLIPQTVYTLIFLHPGLSAMASPLKEELPYDTSTVPFSDALSNEGSSSKTLPAMSATEALLDYAISVPSISISKTLPAMSATEALLDCAISVPSISTSTEALPYNAVSSSSESLSLSEATNNSASTQSTAPLLPKPMENLHATLPPPFLTKLYDLIEDPLTNSIVSWSSGNNSFIVWNLSEFSQCLLPRYFKHSNFSSFVRQLHIYGFKKVNSDSCEFAHAAFLRGRKHLLKYIHRRKLALQASQKNRPLQLQLDNAMVSMLPESCDQMEKLGLEGEFEQLKHDKYVLEADVVRLRQLQESLEFETLAMAKRVQNAERRQDQTMIFLAKAIQSPAFLAQLVQQSERLRIAHDGRKRKHLPSGTKQPKTLVRVEEPQVWIETGKEFADVEEEMQGLTFSMEKVGVLDEMRYAGRLDLSSGDVPSSGIAMLMDKAGEEQSTVSCGTPPQVPLAIGAKTRVSFDSAIITRLDGTLEGTSDDLDLGFDLHNFVKEIITIAENNPPGYADTPDALWGDFLANRN